MVRGMTHSESQTVEDQSSDEWHFVNSCSAKGIEHVVVSIRTNSEMVPWIERCKECGTIDSRALEQTGQSIIKRSLSERAARIAVTADSEPFAFTQRSDEDLTLEEVLGQALGAASMCWVGGTGNLEFDGTRAKVVYEALMREVVRFQRLALEDAATRAVDAMRGLLNQADLSDETLISLRRTVEGTSS